MLWKMKGFITLVSFTLVFPDYFPLVYKWKTSRQKRVITATCCIWWAAFFFYFLFVISCGTAEFSAVENNLVYQVSFVASVLAASYQLRAVNFNTSMWQPSLDFVCSVLFFNKRLQHPLGILHTHIYTNRNRHSVSIACSLAWQAPTLWSGEAVSLTPTSPNLNQGACCGPDVTKTHCLIQLQLYHTDTTEAEFCCTLPTYIVFQRQPPGGKLGK